MPSSPFSVLVADLIGHTGARRTDTLHGHLDIDLDQVAEVGEAEAVLTLEAIADGLVVRGTVVADVVLRCNRCLTHFPLSATAEVTQAYGIESEGNILPLPTDGAIDLTDVLHDELSLAIPLVPLCSEECAGLCPTCGTDLNKEPCEGHPEESASPFAVLQDLLETDAPSTDTV